MLLNAFIYFFSIFFVVVVFHRKICVFIIFISFFDEVSSFCNKILTNQKHELLISNRCFPVKLLALFRMGVGGEAPPPCTSFSPELAPKRFWLLVLTLLPHWCKFSSLYLVSLHYWTWTKTTPQEKWFFWSNPYKINWHYDNFSHRNSRVTKLWSYCHIYNIIWFIW